jgi:proteasome lid subunit RPN8/RPN11
MTLRLSLALVEAIGREGERSYPAESCGVLAGVPGEVKEVHRLVPMLNRRTDDPHRYLIDPEDLRRTSAELREAGLEIVGYYHSHPDHPAYPSAFDTEHAWPWYSYVIVWVEQGKAGELSSWVLADDRSAMHPESIEVFSEV